MISEHHMSQVPLVLELDFLCLREQEKPTQEVCISSTDTTPHVLSPIVPVDSGVYGQKSHLLFSDVEQAHGKTGIIYKACMSSIINIITLNSKVASLRVRHTIEYIFDKIFARSLIFHPL